MTVRPELPPMPDRIARLPVHRGYPVPWFVAWLDEHGELVPAGFGEPEFRVTHPAAASVAFHEQRCWVCGEPRGSWSAYVVGPMCAVNRTSAEPSCHVECAEWSAAACPFLSRPNAKRREGGLPEDGQSPPGIALLRNPGVALVWVVKGALRRKRAPNGWLYDLGEPERVSWWAEGRPATRAEVLVSIESGLPTLEGLAAEQGPMAVRALGRMHAAAAELVPA